MNSVLPLITNSKDIIRKLISSLDGLQFEESDLEVEVAHVVAVQVTHQEIENPIGDVNHQEDLEFESRKDFLEIEDYGHQQNDYGFHEANEVGVDDVLVQSLLVDEQLDAEENDVDFLDERRVDEEGLDDDLEGKHFADVDPEEENAQEQDEFDLEVRKSLVLAVVETEASPKYQHHYLLHPSERLQENIVFGRQVEVVLLFWQRVNRGLGVDSNDGGVLLFYFREEVRDGFLALSLLRFENEFGVEDEVIFVQLPELDHHFLIAEEAIQFLNDHIAVVVKLNHDDEFEPEIRKVLVYLLKEPKALLYSLLQKPRGNVHLDAREEGLQIGQVDIELVIAPDSLGDEAFGNDFVVGEIFLLNASLDGLDEEDRAGILEIEFELVAKVSLSDYSDFLWKLNAELVRLYFVLLIQEADLQIAEVLRMVVLQVVLVHVVREHVGFDELLDFPDFLLLQVSLTQQVQGHHVYHHAEVQQYFVQHAVLEQKVHFDHKVN